MQNNKLTITIQDSTKESSIDVELTNETIYKLYRIKNINNYNSFFEYDDYNDFCTEIEKAIKKFINSIDQQYQKIIINNEQKATNGKEAFIQEVDALISNGYSYQEAIAIVSEKIIKN